MAASKAPVEASFGQLEVSFENCRDEIMALIETTSETLVSRERNLEVTRIIMLGIIKSLEVQRCVTDGGPLRLLINRIIRKKQAEEE
ncbi:MAG: hypothetical protein KW806_01955 [Candidatus Yanofskybacteria bacterium]|nr:hypothetical protein [Candidatus Yanofskybacteria bacterium]